MADDGDLTHCTICFDEYNKQENIPRLLSCTHTLCESCLSDLINASKQSSFKCPECRISHDITERGVKEFPQNKYILSHLDKLEKQNTSDATCNLHKRPLALYCTDSKCSKSLCTLCYIEDHKSHAVTDFVQEAQRRNQVIANDIDTKLKVIVKHKELLKTLEDGLEEETENSLLEINRRQKCLIDQIQSEFQLLALIVTSHRDKEHQKLKGRFDELEEKGLHLVNILQAVNKSTNINIIENYQAHVEMCNLAVKGILTGENQSKEFVHRTYDATCYETAQCDEKIKELVGNVVSDTIKIDFPGLKDMMNEDNKKETVPQPRKYKHGCFEAECGSPKNPSPKQAASAIEYLKPARKFKINYNTISAMHAVSNGNIALAGEDGDGVRWLVLIDQTGRILWTKQLESELSGVTSISLASTPCLTLAYNEGCKIDFHDMKRKDTILFSLDLKGHNPGCLGAKGHMLSYVDWSTVPHSLQFIDCSCFPPEVQEESESIALSDNLIADICFLQRGDMLLAIVSTDKALCAHNVRNGSIQWQISGKIGTSKESLYPWGVCTDDRGHIFVADRSNDCIHLILGNGYFAKTILTGLSYVQEITWDKQHSRLIVQHEEVKSESDSDDNDCTISTFQVSYKVAGSNLGKIMGSLFGSSVGEWVEDNIDTVKYGFSDIGKA